MRPSTPRSASPSCARAFAFTQCGMWKSTASVGRAVRTDSERPLPTFRQLGDEEVTRVNGVRTAAIAALVRRLLDDPVRRERLAQLLADWQRGGFTDFTG